MYLDTFIEINKDKSLEEKLMLFYDNIRNMDRNERDSYDAMIHGSKENETYYRSEAEAMKARVDWLYEDMLEEIKDLKSNKEIKDAYISKIKKSIIPQEENLIKNKKDKVKVLSKEELTKITNYFSSKYSEYYGTVDYARLGWEIYTEIGYIILVIAKEKDSNCCINNNNLSIKLEKDIKNIFGNNINIEIEKKNITLHDKRTDPGFYFGLPNECYFIKVKYNIDEAKMNFINFNNISFVEISDYYEKEFSFKKNNPRE